jgi:predicted outer membrane repeat protein
MSTTCSPTIKHCAFRNNGASGNGGAIYAGTSSDLKIDSCTFSDNRSWGGSGVFVASSKPVISNCTFLNNKTSQRCSGGAISLYRSDASIENCTISNNHGMQGGGIFISNSNPVISACRFDSNSGVGTTIGQDAVSGGAAFIDSISSPVFQQCSFVSNSAAGGYNAYGGGIYINSSAYPVFDGCLFSNNANGAFYINTKCKLLISNCTFINNQSTSGGGISIWNALTKATIVNCNFVVNQATTGGALYIYANNPIAVLNSIFWNNSATTGDDLNGIFSNTQMLYCIIKTGFSAGIQVSQNDPLHLPLSDNGGPAQTCALNDGSPAIDSGVYVFKDANDSLFYNLDGGASYLDLNGMQFTPSGQIVRLNHLDARGISRPQGNGIDLGAYEKE